MKLTIGMAHFDDFDGVYFSIQALRMYHELDDVEIIVVDNSPDSNHGKSVKSLMNWIPNSKYIEMKESTGTTQTRQRVFTEASGDAVLCMDCHVLLDKNAILKLVEFYKSNPETKNLYSGPMLYDNLKNLTTHFNLYWRSEMWGTWGSAYKCSCGKLYSKNNEGQACTMELNPKTIENNICACGEPLTFSYELGTNPNDEPFEIPAQGLGLFTCMKHAWLGFNSEMRGFGGEEGYIHEKFRQAGHKAVCLPFLRWLHRFGRPDGVKYPLTRHNKVRNYVLGFSELRLNLEPVKQHFVDSGLFKSQDWENLLYETKSKAPPTIEEVYNLISENRKDLVWLKSKIDGMESICEFSDGGDAIIPVILANPKKYWIYTNNADRTKTKNSPDNKMDLRFGFKVPQKIEDVDILLLLDFDKTNLYTFLAAAGPAVKKRIIFNNYTGGGVEFIAYTKKWVEENPEWFVADINTEGSGQIMLSKDKADRPEKPIHLWDPQIGAGTELKKVLKLFGIESTPDCSCNRYAAMMNMNGCEWCKSNIEIILDWLKGEADKRRLPFIRAGARLIVKRAIKNAEKALKQS
jgi:hypothetical protein